MCVLSLAVSYVTVQKGKCTDKEGQTDEESVYKNNRLSLVITFAEGCANLPAGGIPFSPNWTDKRTALIVYGLCLLACLLAVVNVCVSSLAFSTATPSLPSFFLAPSGEWITGECQQDQFHSGGSIGFDVL